MMAAFSRHGRIYRSDGPVAAADQPNIGIRRETAATYLKAAGIAFRPPGGWGRQPPAKPANEVITDSAAAPAELPTPQPPAKPANEVITDFGAELAAGATAVPGPQLSRSPSASACAPTGKRSNDNGATERANRDIALGRLVPRCALPHPGALRQRLNELLPHNWNPRNFPCPA